MRSPLLRPANERILDTVILIQPEKTVGAKIDNLSPIDPDGAVGAHLIHYQILEVAVGK